MALDLFTTKKYKDMALPEMVRNKAFYEGMQAFLDGMEHWQNPYAGAALENWGFRFVDWSAGWYYAKQQRAEAADAYFAALAKTD